jgi:general secretion pathway protein F
LVLAIPLVNGRARAESLLRLAFSLQNLAKAGMAPKTSFDIAADSMPNRELARRAREAAAQMRENQSLSDALRSAGLFDPQMNDVVSTGEITGEVPRAMAQVASAQAGDYDARDANFSHLSRVLLYIPLAIMVVTMLAILYLTLYSGIIRQLTTD